MKKILALIALAFLGTTHYAQAQEAQAVADSTEQAAEMLEPVTLTANRSEWALSKTARSVTVISAADIKEAPVQTIEGILEYATSLDVRSRGPVGVQSDVSIRGGHFNQTLVLLNGMKMNDPQTGHFSMNIPVPVHLIDRIEIVYGGASRVFGAGAYSGVINIITKKDIPSNIILEGMYGMDNLYNGGITGVYNNDFSNTLISYKKSGSDGYTDNTAFNKQEAFFQTHIEAAKWLDVDLNGGFYDNKFEAANFYSPRFNEQYEENVGYYTSAVMDFKIGKKWHITPKFSYKRGEDMFDLNNYRNADDLTEWTKVNYHQTDTWDAEVAFSYVSDWGKTSVGGEYRKEAIYSNRLGDEFVYPSKIVPGRDFTDIDGTMYNAYYDHRAEREYYHIYFEHIATIDKVSFTIGGLQTFSEDFGNTFYPGLDITYNFHEDYSVYASADYSTRYPTFTELYLNDPTLDGNPELKEEEAISAELGFKHNSEFASAVVTGFYRHSNNAIDKVMGTDDDTPYITNIPEANFYGVELSYNFNLRNYLDNQKFPMTDFRLNYTYIGSDKDTEDKQSFYALNYLDHNFGAGVDFNFAKHLYFSLNYTLQHRNGTYNEVADGMPTGSLVAYDWQNLLDARLSWKKERYQVYVEGSNLLNQSYSDFGYVPMPGVWVRAGITLNVF